MIELELELKALDLAVKNLSVLERKAYFQHILQAQLEARKKGNSTEIGLEMKWNIFEKVVRQVEIPYSLDTEPAWRRATDPDDKAEERALADKKRVVFVKGHRQDFGLAVEADEK